MDVPTTCYNNNSPSWVILFLKMCGPVLILILIMTQSALLPFISSLALRPPVDMFRKATIITFVGLFARALATTNLNAGGVVYGTNTDCKACAKCYQNDQGTSSLDSTCSEVRS